MERETEKPVTATCTAASRFSRVVGQVKYHMRMETSVFADKIKHTHTQTKKAVVTCMFFHT